MVAAILPFALGLTGLIYGVCAAVLNGVFIILAAAVFANRAKEPAGMKPEKRLFAFSILYLFVLFAALVVDRWGSHDPHPEDECSAASASARDHGLAARRLRHPAVPDHRREDRAEQVTAVAQKNARTAGIMALMVAGMLALAFASVPLYRMFCELTGFDGTPLRAEKAPGAVAARSACASTPTSTRPCPGGSSRCRRPSGSRRAPAPRSSTARRT